MNRSIVVTWNTLAVAVILGITGCGGSTENSVAAPPANPPTAEEIAAQSQAYAAQEKEMRERDRRN